MAGANAPRDRAKLVDKRMTLRRSVLAGAAAGSAGTTALNFTTYLDMALRGRPTSRTPKETIEKLTAKAHVTIPGDDDIRQNRIEGLAPLAGLTAGIAMGSALSISRALGWRPSLPASLAAATIGALLGANVPMTALGITDPRTWTATDWIAESRPSPGLWRRNGVGAPSHRQLSATGSLCSVEIHPRLGALFSTATIDPGSACQREGRRQGHAPTTPQAPSGSRAQRRGDVSIARSNPVEPNGARKAASPSTGPTS